MTTETPTPRPRSTRDPSIDILRGLAMVFMALDHTRDFFFGFTPSPTDLSVTTPILFATRWMTHFCAPIFVLLAGTAAYLYGRRRTPSDLSRFLLTRGLWLIVLELVVVRLGWVPDPLYRFTLLQVIWAIGISMVCLAGLSRLGPWGCLAVGAVIVCGHNTLDPIAASDLGSLDWAWSILHEKSTLEPFPDRRFHVSYPVLPWIGVMCLGYGFGAVQVLEPGRRRKVVLTTGAAMVAAFIALRASTFYGDPVPFEVQDSLAFTLIAFLNCEKYPPSLLFLLMTLGPSLLVLALVRPIAQSRWLQPLATFGRVPLMYYVAHLFLLRIAAGVAAFARFGADALLPPPGPAGSPQLGLEWTYVVWIVAVVGLYPVCVWYDRYKRERDYWWLSYL